MRLPYKVKDANGMTIGAATSQAGAVAVAQQVQGASYIYDAKTGRSFWLDGQRALDKVTTPAEAETAAKAFGTRAGLFERTGWWPVAQPRPTPKKVASMLLQVSRPEYCLND